LRDKKHTKTHKKHTKNTQKHTKTHKNTKYHTKNTKYHTTDKCEDTNRVIRTRNSKTDRQIEQWPKRKYAYFILVE
jgi:chitodextrinase